MLPCVRTRRKPWADDVEEIGTTEIDAVTTLIGKAFAGTRESEPEWSAHWLLGPQLADMDDPRRAHMCGFFLSFAVATHGHPDRGTVIGVRGDGGSLRSVIVVRRMPKAHPLIDSVWSGPTRCFRSSAAAWPKVPCRASTLTPPSRPPLRRR